MPFAIVFISAGFHVPEILLLDVAGKIGAIDPWQSGPGCVNVGAIAPCTLILLDVEMFLLHASV